MSFGYETTPMLDQGFAALGGPIQYSRKGHGWAEDLESVLCTQEASEQLHTPILPSTKSPPPRDPHALSPSQSVLPMESGTHAQQSRWKPHQAPLKGVAPRPCCCPCHSRLLRASCPVPAELVTLECPRPALRTLLCFSLCTSWKEGTSQVRNKPCPTLMCAHPGDPGLCFIGVVLAMVLPVHAPPLPERMVSMGSVPGGPELGAPTSHCEDTSHLS